MLTPISCLNYILHFGFSNSAFAEHDEKYMPLKSRCQINVYNNFVAQYIFVSITDQMINDKDFSELHSMLNAVLLNLFHQLLSEQERERVKLLFFNKYLNIFQFAIFKRILQTINYIALIRV